MAAKGEFSKNHKKIRFVDISKISPERYITGHKETIESLRNGVNFPESCPLTCLFTKRGLFSILVQKSPKVTKKVPVFRKVARSCSLTKKLLRILKVAKKLPSRISKGLYTRVTNRAESDRCGKFDHIFQFHS